IGLQAPAALSLVGFDDANYSDLTQPRISTIRQPARQLGHTAVSIMLRLLNNDSRIPMETRLPVEWIGRDSVGFVSDVPK
ncbi:MAG: substrate-binding domain-containing protein, partial [Pantoea dispersa]